MVNDDIEITILQPTDLNPEQFVIDPTTHTVGIASTSFTASAPISGLSPVMFTGGLTVGPADASLSRYAYAGAALNGAQTGDRVYVRVIGLIQAPWWTWIPDKPVFADNGAFTQDVPTSGWSQAIGRAVDATTLQLLPDPPIYIGE